jgi:hypothetical protein
MTKNISYFLKQFIFAVLFTSAALLIRELFFRDLGRDIPYLTFYPIIAIIAIYGTLTSGIITVFFSISLVYFWIEKGVASNIELWSHFLFILSGLLISYAGNLKNNAIYHEQKTKEELIEQNSKLADEIKAREEADKRLKVANKDLNDKINELQKLNGFMTGREIKMVELKDEILNLNKENLELKEKLKNK